MNLTAEQASAAAAALSAGAKTAGEQLARATGRPWEIRTEVLSDGPAERFKLFLGGTIQPHFGAALEGQADFPASTLVLFPQAAASLLVADFTRSLGIAAERVPDLDAAGVGELANIIAHALIGPLADSLGLVVVLSVPRVAVKTRLEHLEDALRPFEGRDCFMMVAHVLLTSGTEGVESYLAFLIDRAALGKALGAAAA